MQGLTEPLAEMVLQNPQCLRGKQGSKGSQGPHSGSNNAHRVLTHAEPQSTHGIP